MSNFYTAVTAAAIFIPLSFASPFVTKNLNPVTEKVINVNIDTLSESEREKYITHLSYQSCLRESSKSVRHVAGSERMAAFCAESVRKLNLN